jgi:hypothetical protein
VIEFFDHETAIADSVELGMFFLESIEVTHTLIPLTETDDIVDIGYFLRMGWIETDSSTMNLIHTHVGTHTCEIDESIDCRAVPAFSKDSSCTDDNFSFSSSELLCDREYRLFSF